MKSREFLIDWNLYEVHEGKKIWSKYYKRYIKEHVNPNGYIQVILKCIDGKRKYRTFLWHRVIWFYFNGEIPSDKEINHIDENKQNNHISNLECITHIQNIRHGTGIKRQAEKIRGRKHSKEARAKMSETRKGVPRPDVGERCSKAVVAVKDGEVVMEFSSTAEAGRNGFKQGNVSKCCLKKRETHGGYRWFYKEDWLKMQQATHDRVACGKLNPPLLNIWC